MLDFGYYNMDCMDGMKEFPGLQNKKCEQASMERKNYISTEKERWKINSSIILSLKKEKNVGA